MRLLLDRVTGAVTMYKLVIVSLGLLAAIALVLSLTGRLTVATPLALVASLAVAVVATNASSVLAARMAGVQPHLDSSMITALLLFFVLQPSMDAVGLASIALAGVLASASKYLLAVRRRHVLNPAAFGAFVVTVLAFAGVPGFTIASWWVGTPDLFVPVLVTGFLVLYRSQRLLLGLTFTIAAVAVYALVGMSPDAALTALLSLPTVFFAGFMLSEPLTLPPRRWQGLVEAVLVAVLMLVPFQLAGVITNSPQLALLVGNLLAFAVGQRRGIHLEFVGTTPLGETTWELAFQPRRAVRFTPGQYMELTIPHRRADFRGSRRVFSVASAPNGAGPITFAISRPEKASSFKRALLELEPGAVVRATSVGGDFVLPRDVRQPLLLVAGGIGITPFASHLAHAVEHGHRRDIVVVYQTSATGPLPFASLLAESGARVVLFAPEAPSPLPEGWIYAGAGRVDGQRLADAVPDARRRRAYVSGPPALVADLKRALRALGTRRVHTDAFTGY